MMPGPLGSGAALLRQDEAETEIHLQRLARALRVGGKLGCPTLRCSAGSLHPTNIWKFHPGNFTQRAMDALVENTRRLIPIAQDAGCVICPETTQWTVVHDLPTMCEWVDRCDSPWVKVILDPVNHMTAERITDSGAFIEYAISYLGDRIGVLHCKDVTVRDEGEVLVVHIDEAEMGTGLLDHEALIRASDRLAPWKCFTLEHIWDRELWKPAYEYIQDVARRMGHRWTKPGVKRPY
jgi:sugar phosphate isomerase/epimerase